MNENAALGWSNLNLIGTNYRITDLNIYSYDFTSFPLNFKHRLKLPFVHCSPLSHH